MKVFVIHTHHLASIKYAKQALDSFKGFKGWEPSLFEGVTLDTLPKYEKKYPLKLKVPGRAVEYQHHRRFKVKKCCSYNHYRLFKKCVDLNETIAIIEHDSHCISDWLDYSFDDVLVMNSESALNQEVLKPVSHLNTVPMNGIHDICFEGLKYNKIDPALKGKYIVPGTAAYAITPQGAEKMINVYETIGWDQSDFIINTGYVRIQTIMPELFTFKLPNLSMSHGENML